MKQLLCLAAIAGFLPSSLSAAVIVPDQFATIDSTLQSKIVVEQTANILSGGLRYNSGYYAAYQTFTWKGEGPLSGIGVKLAANGSNINAAGPYSYYLRVYEVSALTVNATITETLANHTFNLSGDYRTVTDYLYFALPETLALTDGGYYAFELTPVGTYSTRLTIATAQTGTSTYSEGNGFFANGLSSNGVPGAITGASVNDYVFFLTTPIPEPGSVALLLGGLTIGLLARYGKKASTL